MARPKGEHEKITEYMRLNPGLSLREYGRRLDRSDKGIAYIWHKYHVQDMGPRLLEMIAELQEQGHILIAKRIEIKKQIKANQEKLEAYKLVYDLFNNEIVRNS